MKNNSVFQLTLCHIYALKIFDGPVVIALNVFVHMALLWLFTFLVLSFLVPFLRFKLASSLLNSMIDVRAWAEYVVEWAAKDPYGFLTTVILALTPLFIASALLSWKLAKMIEARDREQKKKQKRQENIAKAKRTKRDWACENEGIRKGEQPPCPPYSN